MKSNPILNLLLLLILTCCKPTIEKQKADYVDPLIGTGTFGHVYPGPLRPFGMVQLSPDTHNKGWNWCSGYHFSDSTIMGFSHLHLSGTGCPDMGDILIMPVTGEPKFNPGSKENPSEGYRSRFTKENEIAKPGYYSVILDDYNIKVELTATERVGMHRYTFPGSEEAYIIIDLGHGMDDQTINSRLVINDNNKVSGYRHSAGFIRDQHIYFHAEFSKPALDIISYADGNTGNEKNLEGETCKMILKFKTSPQEKILVKVGLSTASEASALNNMTAEIPGWDFDKIAEKSEKIWNNELSGIEIDTDDEIQNTIFYTALYHTMISPNLISDIDGSYRGWDGINHQNKEIKYYTNYSLWDTYRATHPFYLLMFPERNNEFICSMLQRYKETGELPINEYGINETFCMIGNHAISVIADAFLKNWDGFDKDLAYEAVKHSSLSSDFNYKSDWDKYMRYGYLPSDSIIHESVSRTLEFTFNDWCVAQMAKKMGNMEDYRYFSERAGFYKNLFDPETLLMRGRKSDGSWVSPFDPIKISHDATGGGEYTEGNAWQYSWHVQHDINGLIDLMGGEEVFASMLDSLFIFDTNVYGDGLTVDVTGLIGQYAHGNEPCHHVAYLYNYAGQAWKTQEMIHRIKTTLYGPGRDGLCGNDDCGQMSAWFIFSSLGFYPVTPGADYYVIGTPSYKKSIIHLPNGKSFTVLARNLSEDNFYIQSAMLNGKKYSKSFIYISDIEQGGIIEFTMGPEPQKSWGTSPEDRPVQRIEK